MKLLNKELNICVVGLGYVGLPLSLAFSEKYSVIGFDLNLERINSLLEFRDITNESDKLLLTKSINNGSFVLTNKEEDIKNADIFIVTVPTPIDSQKEPDLSPLEYASEIIGKSLKEGDIVVYESTVFPGATEEICIPILEKYSGLRFNKDFFCGYSPERINPGDKERSLADIKKIVSGSNEEASKFLTNLYSTIIKAGIYQASSIRVAEAAKIIENVQRDVNIGLVNELAMLFNKLDINTEEVLEAASSKWNFLNFKPGLVGGHCIGIDPYYLTHKANSVGIDTKIVLSSRQVNDRMGRYVASHFVKQYKRSTKYNERAKILILGFAFKDDCPDHRNTRVIDIFRELSDFGFDTQIHDPLVNDQEVFKEYAVKINKESIKNILKDFDAILLAVAHKEYKDIHCDLKDNAFVYDVKSFLEYSDATL